MTIEFGWIVPMVVFALLVAFGADPHDYLAGFLVAEAVSCSALAWELHIRWRDRGGKR